MLSASVDFCGSCMSPTDSNNVCGKLPKSYLNADLRSAADAPSILTEFFYARVIACSLLLKEKFAGVTPSIFSKIFTPSSFDESTLTDS